MKKRYDLLNNNFLSISFVNNDFIGDGAQKQL
jgi:hypothetical protein